MNAGDPREEKAKGQEGEPAGENPAGFAFRSYLEALQRLGEASEVLYLAERATEAREEFTQEAFGFVQSARDVAREEWTERVEKANEARDAWQKATERLFEKAWSRKA